jgi:hypothetical protein
MTSKQKAALRAMIKPMIKEEVARVISDVLPSLLAESIMEIEEQKISLTGVLNESAAPIGRRRAPKPAPRLYTDNPLLNEAMQHTIGGVPQDDAPAHYMNTSMPGAVPEPGNEEYGPIDDYEPENANPIAIAQAQARMGNIIPESTPAGGATDLTAQELATKAPAVFDAITKDYSGVMKKLDAKQNMGHSNIDFSTQPPSNAIT